MTPGSEETSPVTGNTMDVSFPGIGATEAVSAKSEALKAVKAIAPSSRRYEVGDVIAKGGMGAILNAKEATLERLVAMKVMLNPDSPESLARFVSEAKVTGQLEHPNIVPVHELGVDDKSQAFYTMKMVQGDTLRKVLDDLAKNNAAAIAKYPLANLLTIFQKVCDAMAFAHSKGIIHRDLKPENIMIGDFGEVLVMDWGLAKVLDVNAKAPVKPDSVTSMIELHENESGTQATLQGTILGTLRYMAPEQANGLIDQLDARSDIYALGGILYHMLTLRTAVDGSNANSILVKVCSGKFAPPIEAIDVKTKLPHLPGGRVPASLSAVVMKAMALEQPDRYQSVPELQREIAAYQNGFATSAENAGAWKQFTLLVKRNKAASIGVAAVLLVASVLGTKAILEGKRAERGEAKANAALADLKASAPALLQLAESEADSQRFASALGKLDAALALDPALLRALWQRAWVLLALERWSEAADALRLANEHDPANAKLASILPAVEKVAAAAEAGRWKSAAAREVFAHLRSVEATGPTLAFSGKLKLGAEERRKLADQRLGAMLGKGNFAVTVESDGLVKVELRNKALRSLEALRGLPIDFVWALGTPADSLEPLRGMPLHHLNLSGAKSVQDLSPLAGMPLCDLDVHQTKVIDLTPLAGMQLTHLAVATNEVSRIDVLRGMPLVWLEANTTKITDLSPLKGAPLQILNIANTPVTDLAVLQGAPLKELNISRCQQLRDFSTVLKFSHLERLTCDVLPDSLLPLRESKTLQIIDADAWPGENHTGPRPVAEFWKAYDAHQAQRKK